MLHDAHRTLLCGSACDEKSVEWRRKRTNVVCAGVSDIADFVHANRPQTIQRNVGGNVTELGSKRLLQIFLYLSHTLSANENRPDLRQAHAAFAIHHAVNSLADAAI